jgi:hypothetical protein
MLKRFEYFLPLEWYEYRGRRGTPAEQNALPRSNVAPSIFPRNQHRECLMHIFPKSKMKIKLFRRSVLPFFRGEGFQENTKSKEEK